MRGIAILNLAMVIGQVSPQHLHPNLMWNEDTHQLSIKLPLPFEDINPASVVNGDLYQSDILLTDEQWAAKRARKAINSLASRWTEGNDGFPYVPYVFVDSVDRDDVKEALDHWMEHTCIKFAETSDTDQPHLKFHIGTGCWSYIGMIGAWKGQDVSIGSGCNSLGTIVHEVGHAMGFFHEQSRSDRDDHVVILSENIQDGKEGNFDKGSDDNHSVPYDYSSNMHYGMTYFTKNGKPTIVTKNPMAQSLIGTRGGLTHRDKLLANRMYKCIEKWIGNCPGVSSDPCQNDGYIGKDCSCICPTGTSGDNCETVTGDYYAELLSARNEKITTAGEIKVDTPMDAGETFVKWIVPPTCKRAKLTFTSENLYTGDCYFQNFNIKTDPSDYAGVQLCRSDITGGPTYTSEKEIILTMTNRVGYSFARTLWTADVTFEDISGCDPGIVTSAPTTAGPEPPTTAEPEPPTTAGPEWPELPCGTKFKIPRGESRFITSPGFPSEYPKKTKCQWRLKASKKKRKLSIKCDTFSLHTRDFLQINSQRFTGTDNVAHDDAKQFKITFRSRKTGPGFRCLVTSH